MSGRPALIRKREAKQIMEAAKKAGAKEVKFCIGEVAVVIPLRSADDQTEDADDGNNSFDKIMRGNRGK